MTNDNTPDFTSDDLPTMEPSTRKKARKGAAIGLGLFAALLIADDLVKRFQSKKTVKVQVEDKPES